MNGTLPLEMTVEQSTGRMPLVQKTIVTATLEDCYNYQLTRAATLLKAS